MVIPKGYKQTEIGVIPEEWDICTIGSFTEVSLGGTPNTAVFEYWNGDILWMNSGELRKKWVYSVSGRITSKGLKESSTHLIPPLCVLVGLAGQGKTRGTAAINFLPLCTNQSIAAIYPSSKHDSLFLYYIIDTMYNELRELSSGDGGRGGLTKALIKSLFVQIPSLPEQEKIAEALSDTDALIASLEKLIAKKKAMKDGAMQELLTGRKRLPGFDGNWHFLNLIKHSRINARIGWQGLKKSEYLNSGYAILVTGTDLEKGKVIWKNCHYVSKERYSLDKNIQIRNGDILITKDGSLGKVALVENLERPATLNSGIFVIRPLQKAYNVVFVHYILSSFVFRNFLDQLSAGSTIIHLYQKDIDKFEFLIPSFEEQTAIANVLSDMDGEIEMLKRKLAKYRQIKQGMMQQLLTGKIRLV